ncbi:sugar transporter SWEET1-like isoform X2 [Dreissena polymorpha]|uniref:Sugar transporter SWEET1 n=1 Tax=Dreissena polymorpha TaxID=45954 RepID=A0A9D4QPK0_DREPO|nr:sugar transporter SWEET1-like isoform X2 [Dreissena polymorpha]KAH3837705.1 hypothetical protein DPMN_111106 [Dreissena polymorpha]
MELFTAVEAFTQVMTYVMIVAGVPPCLEMIKSRVTEGVPYPFFLAGLVNSLLSIGYGVMVDNSTLIQINAVAGFFNVFYVGSYVFISPKKSAPLQQLLLSVLLVLAVQVYASRLVPEVQRQDHVGFILLVVSTVMLLTPWLQVKYCVSQQSGASLSLVMLGAGIVCCTAWFAYGYLLHDVYIYSPNLLGLSSYVGQIWVLAVYGRAKPRDKQE